MYGAYSARCLTACRFQLSRRTCHLPISHQRSCRYRWSHRRRQPIRQPTGRPRWRNERWRNIVNVSCRSSHKWFCRKSGPKTRLHVSAARQKTSGASTAKARWVPLQHCNPRGVRQDSVGAVFAWLSICLRLWERGSEAGTWEVMTGCKPLHDGQRLVGCYGQPETARRNLSIAGSEPPP